MHSTTPWIEAAHASRLALGLVYFLDEIATVLIQKRPDIIATPSADYMYSTVHKPFLYELNELQKSYPDGALPVVVHYPAQEVGSLFLHLVIAHELGHSVIQEHDLIKAVADKHPDTPGLQEALGQAVSEFASIDGVEAATATIRVRGIFIRWLMEALCDALSVGFLGPSFALTAAAFLTPFGSSLPSPTHPPQTLRTELLLHYLKTWGWEPLLEERVPGTLAWFEDTAATPMDAEGKTYFETLGTLIATLRETIEEVVAGRLGDMLFKPAGFGEQATEIGAFLGAGVLPAQLLNGRPTDRRAVLLAGWLHRFEEEGGTPEKLPVVLADRRYQAFLAKALEMSTVLEHWEAA